MKEYGAYLPKEDYDEQHKAKKKCLHHVIRKKRTTDEHQYTETVYVCGSCATLFDVTKHKDPPPIPPVRMDDGRKPWGTRDRQA